MRIAPGRPVPGVDPFRLGCEVAATTHGHPSGYLAAGFMTLVISRVVAGETLGAARKLLGALYGVDAAPPTWLAGPSPPLAEARLEQLVGGSLAASKRSLHESVPVARGVLPGEEERAERCR